MQLITRQLITRQLITRQLKGFVFSGLVAIAAAGVIATLPQNAQAADSLRNTVSQTIAAAPQLLKSGNFKGADHPTQGQAKIIVEKGQRYLELSQGFKSDGGPDLQVLLHKSGNPTDYSRDSYVNLGKLQKVAGSQRYAIPANVSVNEFNSAVIWCRAFNITFGFASLG